MLTFWCTPILSSTFNSDKSSNYTPIKAPIQSTDISFRQYRTGSLAPQLTLKTKCHAKADPKTLIRPAVTGRLPKINALILSLPQKKKLQTGPVTMATVISFCHGCQCQVHLHHATSTITKRGLKFEGPLLVHNQSVMQSLTYANTCRVNKCFYT